ncbi:hypothetical protein WJU16_18675 [Chitinophaga pollutisoli]|uniref:Uncharacterized protein n=1 Tax=Chitinophaga pollutisoli TaxID=3133966 RepID=A0ABZ2YJU4_9BACT
MKSKEDNNATEKMVRVPEKGLLSLVSSKLKDRVLFPQKLEDAKEYLKKVTFSKP